MKTISNIPKKRTHKSQVFGPWTSLQRLLVLWSWTKVPLPEPAGWFDDQLPNFNTEISKRLNVGSSLVVKGNIVETRPQAQQPFEIKATSIAVEGASAPDYPLRKRRGTFSEFLRTNKPTWGAETNTFSAMFRIRSMLAYACWFRNLSRDNSFLFTYTLHFHPAVNGRRRRNVRVTNHLDMENPQG